MERRPLLPRFVLLRLLATLLAALAPAAYLRWRDGGIERHADDPALPELLLARQQRVAFVVALATLVITFVGGIHALWGVPLAVAGVLAASHHVQRVLHGERWSLGAYLRYHLGALVGGFGFWLLLAFTPMIVAAVAGRRPSVALGAAGALAIVLLAWEHAFARVWLRAHRASPLGRESLGAALWDRLQEIARRSAADAPALHRFGAPGMRLVNAVALPSRRGSSVAFSDTLLEVLDHDEVVAVFAHEIAHVEHWDRRHLRRAHVATILLIAIVCGLHPLLLAIAPRFAGWVPSLIPLVVLVGLALRVSRARAHETASDLRAAELCGNPDAVARMLVKLHLHARIPRRWPHELERAATHPSLQRRLQALAALDERGASAPSPEPDTVIRSTTPGRWVVLDDARAHWLDGVDGLPDDSPPALADLRERAASARSLSYAQLGELRLAASGNERVLVAATTTGERWRTPLAASDVGALQARLDRVDHRLGRRAPASSRLDATVARLVAAILFLSLVLLPAPGVAGIVFVATLLWPSAATLAASGTTALALAAVALSDLDAAVAGDAEHTMLLLLAVGGAGTLLLAFFWWRARLANPEARPDRTPALVAIGIAAAIAALWWLRTPSDGPRHLLVLLAGGGAALAAMRERSRRRAGLALAGLAAVGLAGTELARRSRAATRLAWREGTLAIAREVPLAASGELSVSPGARAFAVRHHSEEEEDVAMRAARFEVGPFTGPPRTLDALALRFVDDERLLVLRAAGDSVRLSLESVRGDAAAPWQVVLARVAGPQLGVDRTTGAWRLTGYDGGLLLSQSGTVGSTTVTTTRDAAPAPGLPLHTTPAGVRYLAAAPMTGPFTSWRAATGRLRWELVRARSNEGGRHVLARLDGYPTCEGLGDGASVVCASSGPGRPTIWRVDDGAAPAGPVATLPRGGYLQRVGPNGEVASLRYVSSDVYLADVTAGRGLRLKLPRDSSDSPMDLQAAQGHLAVLRYRMDGRVRVVLYRVR